MRSPSSVPSLRFHKPSGRFYVWDSHAKARRYLGTVKHQAEKRYQLIVASLRLPEEDPKRPTGPLPAGPVALTVEQALEHYVQSHVIGYYTHTSTRHQIQTACGMVADRFGSQPAVAFGPRDLKHLQQAWLQTKSKNARRGGTTLARTYVNALIKNVQQAWRWLATEEIVPAANADALGLVPGLRKGRGGRETLRVTPVPSWAVEATLEFCRPTLAAMIQFQRATGSRPQDVCNLRPRDVSRGPLDYVPLPGTTATVSARVLTIDGVPVTVWAYVPASHKTLAMGKPKTIAIGPAGQAALIPYLESTAADDYCFTPQRLCAERAAELRAARKSPVQPSQVNRGVEDRERPPGLQFTTHSYSNALKHTIRRANTDRKRRGLPPIPHWTPNQLRHDAGTRYGDLFGRETARALLGHSGPDTVDIYMEQSLGRAMLAAAKAG